MSSVPITGNFEDDVAQWLRDEIAVFPERLHEKLYQKAQQRRELGRRGRDLPELTIKNFLPVIHEWAVEMMDPEERRDWRMRRMTDRDLLERIYEKLYPE